MTAMELLKSRRLLKEFTYDIPCRDKGYSDKTLHINVTNNQITIKDVPPLMKEKFIILNNLILYIHLEMDII